MKLPIYESLKEEVLSCQKCDLGCEELDGRDPHVMGQGNLDADIMFIAEAPGLQETIYERPLTPPGTSGRVYQNILKYLGLTREEVYTTNTVLCRPEKNRDPLPYEAKRCEDFFVRQIELVKPNLVVTFGRFAAQTMLGYIKITEEHGKIKHSEKFNVDVFPMYHPAYFKAYATAERRREFKADVRKLSKILNQYRKDAK